MLLSLRIWSSSHFVQKVPTFSQKLRLSSHKTSSQYFSSRHLGFHAKLPSIKNAFISAKNDTPVIHSVPRDGPLDGIEDILVGYILGKKKATEVAHLVWKSVIRKGDKAVDATCGNGYDTLAMVKLVADDSGRGCVYGMDIQKDAVESTSSLLEASLNPTEKQLVKLFHVCHSKMGEAVQTSVRLVAFNLGYLPGGDKEIITKTGTTLLALEAATRIVTPGGLISLVVYVGHAGGRDEYEAVQSFATTLSTEDWICCKLEMLNRACAPVPIFLFRR